VATLVVDGGSREGEGLGIVLSGVQTSSLETGAARGETGRLPLFISLTGGVSLAPWCP